MKRQHWLMIVAALTLSAGLAASQTERRETQEPLVKADSLIEKNLWTGQQLSPKAKRLGGIPLRFQSEVVRMFVEGDTLRVEGTYHFKIRPPHPPVVTLLYPYAADSLLGGAKTVSLESRKPGGRWQRLVVAEAREQNGARWNLSLGTSHEIEVRTVYRQALLANYARYEVTSARAWRQPIQQVRFEIHLPAGAEPSHFSFPFTREQSEDGIFYVYEAENLLPESDVIVRWDMAPAAGR